MMKGRFRLVIIFASCILLYLIAWLVRHVSDLLDQYSAGGYLNDLWNANPNSTVRPSSSVIGDKVIVMARLEEEQTGWVSEFLPDWQQAVYITNPSQSSIDDPSILTTPLNKGHEGMAYLTYIIEHYPSFPATIAFLHPHRSGFLKSWHVDAPLHDNAIAMQALQIPFVHQSGYVNLRCNWNPGCTADRKNGLITEDVWSEMFSNTSTPPRNETVDESTSQHGNDDTDPDLDPEEEQPKQTRLNVPKRIGVPCCAQFAVSQSQILKRPVDDYIHFRQWLIDTPRDDASSGRVMEYLWHIIFGKDSVFCPNQNACYCNVYGRC